MFGAVQRPTATLASLGEVAQQLVLEQKLAATTLCWAVCTLEIAAVDDILESVAVR